MNTLELGLRKAFREIPRCDREYGFIVSVQGFGNTHRGVLRLEFGEEKASIFYAARYLLTEHEHHELSIATDVELKWMLAEAIVYSGTHERVNRVRFLNDQLDYPMTLNAFLICDGIIQTVYAQSIDEMERENPSETFCIVHFLGNVPEMFEEVTGFDLKTSIRTIREAINVASL